MVSKALITGITGQDGYYLTKLLLSKDYEVHGLIRRTSTFNTDRIDELIAEYTSQGQLKLYYSDLLDSSSLNNLINSIKPNEIYNLAAQSHVAVSFKNPVYTSQVGTLGSVSLLEAIRNLDYKVKYYQASSSEMYGGELDIILNENSKLEPKSPYAASKVFAHHMTQIYRDSYNLFCSNGILFNHESPLRGETFVTRKITRAVGRNYKGIQKSLILGNLEAQRDWGFSGDYVEAMWMILQADRPDDWVVATGEKHSVKEFLKIAFEYVNLDFEKYVKVSEKYFRPNEVDYLLGDASKIINELGWKPKTDFNTLVKMMVDHDIELAEREKVLLDKNLIKKTWDN